MNRRIFYTRRRAATTVAALCWAGFAGALVMAVAHTGADVPVVSDLGPGRPIPPVAAGFFLGAALYAGAALAARTPAPRPWRLALAVNGVAFVAAAFPFRGAVSAAAVTVSLAAMALLCSRAGRQAFGVAR